MAASSMKDIKTRIKSVEGTMHITKAMELVASSKLRRAKERAQLTLPFMNLLHDTMSTIVSNCGSGVVSAYTEKREQKKICIVLVAGDRGLAGGFNNNVFKEALGIANGKVLETLTLEEYKSFDNIFEQDVFGEISLETCVNKRISKGGTSPKSVEEQIAYVKGKLNV